MGNVKMTLGKAKQNIKGLFNFLNKYLEITQIILISMQNNIEQCLQVHISMTHFKESNPGT